MSQTDASTDYFAVITDAGSALEAEAHAKGVPVKISHIAVGDGDGEVPVPARGATALVHEVYRRPIDARRIDPDDPGVWWISCVIPADVGGFWIREFGVYAQSLEEDGEPVLYGYGNHAPYYKVEKVLGQASTHELEIPVIMSGQANLQIVVKDSGYASQSALNDLAIQIGQMKIVDASYGERIAALEAFDDAHDVAASVDARGHVKPDGATIAAEAGVIRVVQGPHWLLGEFYFFRHPVLREGFEVLDGATIENGSEIYPEFWQWAQTSEGAAMLLSAQERAELAARVYYTAEEYGSMGFAGIGGVPYFTLDMDAGSIIMPDVRGMHIEAAGLDLEPGASDIDRMRNVSGQWNYIHASNPATAHGACAWLSPNGASKEVTTTGTNIPGGPNLQIGRIVPIGQRTGPARFGMLPCAWMGKPAVAQAGL